MLSTHEPGINAELARNLIAGFDRLTRAEKSTGATAKLCFGFAVRQCCNGRKFKESVALVKPSFPSTLFISAQLQ